MPDNDNEDIKKGLSALHKKILVWGGLAAAFVAFYATYNIIKPDEIAFIPEVEAKIQEAQDKTLEKVDEKMLDTSDIQMQLGNKIYGDTIRGLRRELRQIKREQELYNDIPQDLIDSEDDILEEIADEQALLDEIKTKLKKRLE